MESMGWAFEFHASVVEVAILFNGSQSKLALLVAASLTIPDDAPFLRIAPVT